VKIWKSSIVYADNSLLSRNMIGALVKSLVYGILLLLIHTFANLK